VRLCGNKLINDRVGNVNDGCRSDSLCENVLKQLESPTHDLARLYERVSARRRSTLLLSPAAM